MATFSDINAIASDSNFQGRCMYALYVAAVNVMGESNQTANHAARTLYAASVIRGTVSAYSVALVVLTSGLVSGEADITQIASGAAIVDADIQTIVSDDFNALAGIGT